MQRNAERNKFSGHDTTSASIAWTLYLLAQHPECQQKARQEALLLENEYVAW